MRVILTAVHAVCDCVTEMSFSIRDLTYQPNVDRACMPVCMSTIPFLYEIRLSDSAPAFKSALKTHLLKSAYNI